MKTETIEWIDVNTALPEDSEELVLVYDRVGDVWCAVYDEEYDRFVGESGYSHGVKYWAHMPKGPNGVGDYVYPISLDR